MPIRRIRQIRVLLPSLSAEAPAVRSRLWLFAVAAAEAGHLDLHQRALLGVAVVAADARHCVEVREACERLVAARPELTLLAARRRLIGEEDDA